MTAAAEFVVGCLLLAGALGLLASWYLHLPRSGVYNRPEEAARLATRPRMGSARFRGIVGLVALGVVLIVEALR